MRYTIVLLICILDRLRQLLSVLHQNIKNIKVYLSATTFIYVLLCRKYQNISTLILTRIGMNLLLN